jgi:hypothetical protein
MAEVERNSIQLQIRQDHSTQHENNPIERQREENIASEDSDNSQSLLPADGGAAAWTMLIGAFMYEAILWGESPLWSLYFRLLIVSTGFPLSFGVFQNYYSQLPQFKNDPYLPIVGSMATGLAYLGGPFMIPLVKRFPKYHKHMILVGWPLCIIALVAGSFATTLPGLVITQGVMYGRK